MSIQDTQDTLARLGIEPKKSLGQNFMVEQNALLRLADAADLAADDTVLEVGAGLGALTAVLAERAGRVVAVEIDQRFVAHLERRFHDQPHVEIVEVDMLATPPAALLDDDADNYVVVANLPYYITSAVIRHLLEANHPPRRLVLTVQREVAQRITAAPGNMSLLAVSVQYYGRPELVTRLSRGNFYPRPNVESAVLRIDPHPAGPPLPPEQTAQFFRVVRAGFSQPRKQVKNCLAAGLPLDKDSVLHCLEAAGLDPRRRAETFSVGEWLTITRELEKML